MGCCAVSDFWSALADGVRVRVRVTPRARQAGIGGVVTTADGPALACQVAAAAEDGKANDALVAALAESLAVPRRAVNLEIGASRRIKRLKIAGDPAVLAARLARLA